MKRKPHEFPLGDMSETEFLSQYWQKRPILIRQAFLDFPELVSGDELAGLACDKDVTSRIIIERGGKTPWEVKHGPFRKKDFSALPKKRWTLLVNGVDRFVPEVNRLMDYFSFVPNWRIDDVMISYAADNGGVGAHVDNYDVFLIQAQGRREWQIHTTPVLEDDFIPGRAVRQLKKFKPNKTWVLEPGDMLYLPPRVPHNGIAVGDGCMTYSIGFRAPSHAELLDSATSFSLSRLDEKLRYSDPDLVPQHPGEIGEISLDRVLQILRSSFLNREELIEWFGCYLTEPKDEPEDSPPDEPMTASELKKTLRNGAALFRGEGARIAFSRVTRSKTLLFVNGRARELSGKTQALAPILSDAGAIDGAAVQKHLATAAATELVLDLVNDGVLYLVGEE